MGPLAFHYPFVLIHFLSLHYKLTSDAWIGCWILCIQPSVGFTFHLLLNLTNHSFWVSWESWHFIFYFLLDPILWCVYGCTGYKWTCGTLKLPKKISWFVKLDRFMHATVLNLIYLVGPIIDKKAICCKIDHLNWRVDWPPTCSTCGADLYLIWSIHTLNMKNPISTCINRGDSAISISNFRKLFG